LAELDLGRLLKNARHHLAESVGLDPDRLPKSDRHRQEESAE
jgi:hypothetical protein